MDNQILPPPQPGTEPVFTHLPETINRKSDEQIAEQIARIGDKLIKRAQAVAPSGSIGERGYFTDFDDTRVQHMKVDDKSLTLRLENESSTNIKRNGNDTELNATEPGPKFLSSQYDTSIEARQGTLSGLNSNGEGHNTIGVERDKLSKDEIVVESARLLGDARNGIVKLEQADKKK
jgi:hypothetical protein